MFDSHLAPSPLPQKIYEKTVRPTVTGASHTLANGRRYRIQRGTWGRWRAISVRKMDASPWYARREEAEFWAIHRLGRL